MRVLVLAAALLLASAARAQFVITEFMAANDVTLNDEDGENSDWIEIQNEGPAPANLAGWYLTDTTNTLTKWQFPATNLPPSGYLVVFASEKDRRRPGAPLHTNFKLGSGGEYLALVGPDGVSVVSQFAPGYPSQVADVSYGLARDSAAVPLLVPGAPVRVWVPPSAGLGLTWTAEEFDDSSWTGGTTGVGYDRQPLGVDFLPLIGLNVESMMYSNRASIYVRIPFTVEHPGDFSGLTLRLKFEDGFIGYLNGQEVARSNAPVNATYNSVALAPRTDVAATNFLDFDLSEFRSSLLAGTNVLAFHGLNNPTNSPDFLLLPQLNGVTRSGPAVARYFPVPTPGRPNNAGVAALGPIVSEARHIPAQPADGDALTVTARLRSALAPVAVATLRYRVMFGSEVSLPFLDDGAHGDGAAGDGIFGAVIPPGASAPGQMVRWFISATDVTGTNISRYPAFQNTNESAAYLGTVVIHPALTNALPVFHWFVQNVAGADTLGGTRGAVYWNGEFYDNVFCRVRGATAPSFAKKPYKFDFNPGDHFRFQPGQPRVDELNLNSTYQDKAHVRAPLAFETYRAAGAPASDAFSVRVQQNGAFYSVAVFVEQVDGTFLERRDLDPNGALYKMFNGFTSSTTGVEKKTRRNENNADLQVLVNGLSLGSSTRGTFLFDNIDLPSVINYLAAGIISQDLDRMIKNFYCYRDTAGTRLWTMLPWDKDLTFGLFGLQCDVVSGNDDSGPYQNCRGGYISHPFVGTQSRNFGHVNNLVDAIYAIPVTREMFLRRLRTLMDQLLQPPGTPAAQLRYEGRLNELLPYLQPDATLDLAKWGAGFGQLQTLTTAMGAIKNNYLAQRRVHLYQTHSIDNLSVYPAGAGIPHTQAARPPLAFGVIESNPVSANQDQEYIELRNPTSAAVDISGWELEGGVDFTFAPGTVVPANGRVYVSPNLAAFRARTIDPRGGQGLLVVGPYAGQLSARGEPLRLRDAAGSVLTTNTYTGNPSLAQQFLRITELMYHPTPLVGNANAADEFEFVEVRNISTAVSLDLRGVRFVDGIEFGFTGSAVTSLAPGASALVVRNLAAFTARYGALPVAGQYAGALDNQGERIRLIDAAGEEVLDFAYADDWHPVTDGLGFSLVVVDERAEPDAWGSANNWRPSGALAGSPALPDPPPPALAPILVNEVLSRTDTLSAVDSIELFNPTAEVVETGGWFLSDDFNTPKKFRIPAGTPIAPDGFRVFSEADFNLGGLGFAFSSFGDEAWLFSADAQGNLTGFAHGFQFGAGEDGVSFGRHRTSVGEEHLVAQRQTTLGALNTSPRVGPVVISEIQYHPSAGMALEYTRLTPFEVLLRAPTSAALAAEDAFEFVELQNLSSNAVPLFDPLNPANTWQLRGAADFDFPPDITLAPGATLLVVGVDPVADTNALASFRAAYDLDVGVRILGPWSGHLADSGARLELEKPDEPVAGTVPRILVDAVHYGDSAPWPPEADGMGGSLQRRNAGSYGDDAGNWFAAAPRPGVGAAGTVAPVLSISALGAIVWPTQPAGFNLETTATLAEPVPWEPELSPRVEEQGFFKVTVPLTATTRFYRLRGP